MYNRYVRNDSGVYRTMHAQQENDAPRCTGEDTQREKYHGAEQRNFGGLLGKDGLLSGILGKLLPGEVDTGDLILLVLLILLFREGADEELLIALGLLLIL